MILYTKTIAPFTTAYPGIIKAKKVMASINTLDQLYIEIGTDHITFGDPNEAREFVASLARALSMTIVPDDSTLT